jgi:hypothetical protein
MARVMPPTDGVTRKPGAGPEKSTRHDIGA